MRIFWRKLPSWARKVGRSDGEKLTAFIAQTEFEMADSITINQDTAESKPLVRRSDRKKTVPTWTLFAINFYWFPLFFHSTFISNIVAPAQVLHYTQNNPSEKGSGLGLVRSCWSDLMRAKGLDDCLNCWNVCSSSCGYLIRSNHLETGISFCWVY